MPDYRRLISYIYAYEGGIKKHSMGYAKVELRGGVCRIQVNVKRVYVGSSEIGVYLLAAKAEIFLGRIFIRNGAGEFRIQVNPDNIDGSGCTMEECYGLTVHEVDSTWQSYTTIWEDAVAQTAELQLAEVTADNVRKRDPKQVKESYSVAEEIQFELEREEERLEQAPPWEEDYVSYTNRLAEELEKEDLEASEKVLGEETVQNVEMSREAGESVGEKAEPMETVRKEDDEAKKDQCCMEGISKTEITDMMRKADEKAAEEKPTEAIEAVTEFKEAYREGEKEIENRLDNEKTEPFKTECSEQEDALPPDPEDPEKLRELDRLEQEDAPLHHIWGKMQSLYPNVRAFDYDNGCEILSIKPQDIGLLPREIWVFGNNSFLLHGYYNYRHLILARLNNPKGSPRYLLGVPGHYFSNEKYMASMFGFPHFVLAKRQPEQDGRFGYWYTDIRL